METSLQFSHGRHRRHMDDDYNGGGSAVRILGRHKTFFSGANKMKILRHLMIPIFTIQLIFFVTAGILAVREIDHWQEQNDVLVLMTYTLKQLSNVQI